MTKTEYVSGAESQEQTPASRTPPTRRRPTTCRASPGASRSRSIRRDGADHTIDKPKQYDRWRDYAPSLTPPWPGKMLSWTYSHPHTLEPVTRVLFPHEAKQKAAELLELPQDRPQRHLPRRATQPHEVTLVNWPQNDYWEHNVIDKPAGGGRRLARGGAAAVAVAAVLDADRGAAPRRRGRAIPGSTFAPTSSARDDGLAMAPYFRESRRIKAVFTVTENHVGCSAATARREGRKPDMKAEQFADTVGIGHYNIDLHPSTGGRNYIDVPSLPFQIPLGALLPVRMENLLPACKNLGVTHITNGCYRLHPVEWNIGEIRGLLAAFCLEQERPAAGGAGEERAARQISVPAARPGRGAELAGVSHGASDVQDCSWTAMPRRRS